MEINELADYCYTRARANGHYDRQWTFPELMMMVTCELAEAVEADRREMLNPLIELADALIILLGVCAHYDMDVEAEMMHKLEFNKGRPYKHNKKY